MARRSSGLTNLCLAAVSLCLPGCPSPPSPGGAPTVTATSAATSDQAAAEWGPAEGAFWIAKPQEMDDQKHAQDLRAWLTNQGVELPANETKTGCRTVAFLKGGPGADTILRRTVRLDDATCRGAKTKVELTLKLRSSPPQTPGALPAIGAQKTCFDEKKEERQVDLFFAGGGFTDEALSRRWDWDKKLDPSEDVTEKFKRCVPSTELEGCGEAMVMRWDFGAASRGQLAWKHVRLERWERPDKAVRWDLSLEQTEKGRPDAALRAELQRLAKALENDGRLVTPPAGEPAGKTAWAKKACQP